MEHRNLDFTEAKVLYAIHRAPNMLDKDLAKLAGDFSSSTFTSAKARLKEKQKFKVIYFPMLQKVNCEFLGIIFTNFSPVKSLQERVTIAKDKIESFPEIFYSIGDPEKGFSLSLCENYTNFNKINEVRTEIFGKEGLLENEYPHQTILPFEIAKFRRFFDFSPMLAKNLAIPKDIVENTEWPLKIGEDRYFKHFSNRKKAPIKLSENDRAVYYMLINHPEYSSQKVGEEVGKILKKTPISRHTVARIRNKLEKEGLLVKLVIPDLQNMNVELLAFYHFLFDPKKPATDTQLNNLITPSTIFFANKKFEAVMISIYEDYNEYKTEKTKLFAYLKQQNLITQPDPIVRRYLIDQLEIIKNFELAPITKKCLNLDFEDV